MDAHSLMLIEQFDGLAGSFENAKEAIINKLRSMLDEKHVKVNGVEGRVKGRRSLEGKLERKGYKYKTLSDITDLI
ncbi:MAG: hypothetical protein MJ072_04395, partial [Clostridia bacterium]|nr:hypothetical protein [Clostridia bacterium]